MGVDELYSELVEAVSLEGDRAVLRMTTTYEPAGGQGSRVFPPTYPRGRDLESPYVLEERRMGGEVHRVVLMDAVPPQAKSGGESAAEGAPAGAGGVAVAGDPAQGFG